MRFSRAGWFLFATVACSGADAKHLNAGPTLVGTWRALDYVVRWAGDSARTFPFGRPPRGYLVYDATGHVFFQAVRGVAAQREVRWNWENADATSLRQLLSDASAFFGTYRANYSTGTVVHHIEAETPPHAGTSEVATPFRVHGDSLTLGADSTTHWTFIRVKR